MIRKLLQITLTSLLVSIVLLMVLVGCDKKPMTREQARNYWCRVYDAEDTMIRAIVAHETGAGRWNERCDYYRLSKQQWAWGIVNKYHLDAKSKLTWSSLGDLQILYLNAVVAGFKGSPEMLRDNYSTNYKYGVRHFVDLRNWYDSNTLAVASYNAGRPRYKNGVLLNINYVLDVKKWYYKFGGRIWTQNER